MDEKIGNKIHPISPRIKEAYRIFKLEQKYDTKQNYKKAFKKANTRKVCKKYFPKGSVIWI